MGEDVKTCGDRGCIVGAGLTGMPCVRGAPRQIVGRSRDTYRNHRHPCVHGSTAADDSTTGIDNPALAGKASGSARRQ